MTPPRRVLFVCLHGSAKSLIALEHFRRLAAGRRIAVEAAAAGTAPDAEIPRMSSKGFLAMASMSVHGDQISKPPPAS